MSIRQRLERVDAFVALAIALVAVPIVVAVARAISQRWIPIGDQALLEIRARDVLTTHHPLLGTASSAALNRDGGVALNHPGPLMFDALAIPVRAFGGGAGVAIGVGAVNLSAAVLGIVFAARRGGRAGAALAALSFAALGWAAGSESLYDPYNPTAAMLPCLACLFLAWCTADLDATALLWLIGTASFVVQLNNSYLLFVTPLVVAVCCVYAVRSRHEEGIELLRLALRAGIVFVVVWSQPFIEQLLHGSDGNIARMVRSMRVLGDNPGARLGTQIAAATLTLPPWWSRSEFDGIGVFSPVPGFLLAGASLVGALAVCVVGCRWARQHRQRDAFAAMMVAGLSIAIAWLATIRSPVSPFFGIGSDYVRWLWPAGIFLWFATLLTLWRVAGVHLAVAIPPRARLVIASAAITVVAVANVPAHAGLRSPRELDRHRPEASRWSTRRSVASTPTRSCIAHRRGTTCTACRCSPGSRPVGSTSSSTILCSSVSSDRGVDTTAGRSPSYASSRGWRLWTLPPTRPPLRSCQISPRANAISCKLPQPRSRGGCSMGASRCRTPEPALSMPGSATHGCSSSLIPNSTRPRSAALSRWRMQ